MHPKLKDKYLIEVVKYCGASKASDNKAEGASIN